MRHGKERLIINCHPYSHIGVLSSKTFAANFQRFIRNSIFIRNVAFRNIADYSNQRLVYNIDTNSWVELDVFGKSETVLLPVAFHSSVIVGDFLVVYGRS